MRSAAIIWLLVPALFAPVARAESPEDEELEVELFFAPAETVTSAARHEQPIEQSPSAITVLTREDIEASGARSLPEVLRLVPNMDILMMKPIWYVVGVRGNTPPTSESTLLLVDGRDMTVEFFGFPSWSVQHYSMDEVERIEVIRGPGSALYGANAYSGVVQVITRKPQSDPGMSLSVRGGEHGFLELGLHGDQSLGPVNVAVGAGMARESFWTDRRNLGKDAVRGRLVGEVKPSSDSRLLVETGAYRIGGEFYTDMGQAVINSIFNFYGRLRFELDDLMVQAVYDRYDFDVDVDMGLTYKPMQLELARLPSFIGQMDKASIQANYAVEFHHNRVTFGAEYVFNQYDSVAFVDPVHREHRGGLLVQDEVDLAGLLKDLAGADLPPLFLTAGLRLDLNSITSLELSPRASFVFMPADNHGLRLGYAHAFLKPTFLESSLHLKLHSDIGFESLDAANPDLANQTIDSIELGYSGRFLDDRLVVRLDFAYNWYRDSIWFAFDPEKMGYVVVGGMRVPNLNASAIRFANDPIGQNGHDLDLQITGKPTDDFRVFLAVGYRQIFDSRSGAFRTNEPVWHLVLGADLRGDAGWSASLRAFCVDSYRLTLSDPESILEPMIEMEVPAAWFLNARFAWKLGREPPVVTVGIEGFNLLGFRFREYAGLTPPNGPDYGGERFDRRVVVFLRGDL